MKILKHSFILLLLCTICTFGFAQYQTTQNVSFTAPSSPACYETTVLSQNGSWSGNTVTVTMTHNISNVVFSNANENAHRYLDFEIYHDDGTQLIYVKTVTRYANWLAFYTADYELHQNDLDGVPEGKTVVKLKVRYSHYKNVSYSIDLFVENNGQAACSFYDFEDQTVVCDMGQIDCFYYIPCGEATIIGMATPCSDPGGNPGVCYTFDATIPNGSGNYTYYWEATYKAGSNNSFNATFNLFHTQIDRPVVTVSIVDVVTGCTYFVSTGGKQASAIDMQLEEALIVAPNPSIQGGNVSLQYVTESQGNVSISLYDLQGKEVQRIYNADETAGSHNLDFAAEVPAGLYLLSMRTATGMTSQKLLIQK